MAKPPFIDMMPELQALADKNKDLSPHEVARKFLLEESAKRGGIEFIVATDKDGKFLGAGTQNIKYSIDWPPSILHLLSDPQANMIIHHNHPPGENQFFSPEDDMASIGDHCGIGWMFMHTDQAYSAMRGTNRMFQPDASGVAPKGWLEAAYESGLMIARRRMYGKVTEEILEDGAPELALRALRQVGAIEYHSNIQTGLSHEYEQTIIRQICDEATNMPGRTGGRIIWTAPEKPDVSATSGRIAATGGADELSAAPPITLELNRFVDFISRQNAAAPDSSGSGGPQSPQLPGTGGKDSGLASGGSARRPILEAGLKPSRPAPV